VNVISDTPMLFTAANEDHRRPLCKFDTNPHARKWD